MSKITVFLSNWHDFYREGIHYFLASELDIQVIGEATSSEETISFIESHPSQVAILTVNGDQVSGFEIARNIKQRVPLVSVILFVDREDEELLFSAMKSGASACLTRDIDPEDLVSIVREVAQGGQPISKELLRPGLAIRVLEEFEANYSLCQKIDDYLMARLIPPEAELLRLADKGISREQAAADLGLSEEAISHRLDLILTKLVANDRTRQLIEATMRGYVNYLTDKKT